MNPRDELDPARTSALRSLLVDHARADSRLSPARARRRRTVLAASGFGFVAVIAAGVVAITLAGLPLFGTTPVATDPPVITVTPTPVPSVTPTPTPTPPPPASPAAYTCDTLVAPDVLAGFAVNGLEVDELWPNDTANYGTLHQHFAEYGGVSCRWGVPNSDNVAILSYAPVTAEQAAIMQGELTARGYTSEDHPDGTVFLSPELPGDFFLFTGDAVYETNGSEHFGDLVPYQQASGSEAPSSQDTIAGYDSRMLWNLCVAHGVEEFPGAEPASDYGARFVHLTPDGVPEVYVSFTTPEVPMGLIWICQFGGDPDAPTLDFFNAKDI
ncbi:hypothetical protein ACEXOS_002655 [Herbiconiux sp. P16]|uniref:hypothetical protein n=1 Tax=Herbiconiux wuyangfengii TaxID=3342794 RepID=UPI0035B87471